MNTRIRAWGLLATLFLVVAVGCFKSPDISVDASGWGRERPNTTRVPPTTSHDQARAELRKAYGEIEHLKKENEKLKRKNKDLEQDKKRLEDKLDK